MWFRFSDFASKDGVYKKLKTDKFWLADTR